MNKPYENILRKTVPGARFQVFKFAKVVKKVMHFL